MINIIYYGEIDIMYGNEIKKMISDRRARGETFRRISADMNISISSIHSILNRKLHHHKKKTGPKRKLDKSLLLCIKRTINDGVAHARRVTSTGIIKELQLSLSPLTVRRNLHRTDVIYKKAKHGVVLSKNHMTLRKENIQWSKVIFSDEKQFCQDGLDNWCSFVLKNVVLHRNKRQNGGRGIMV